MSTEAVVKVFPGILELSEVKTNVKCPELGCTSIFRNTSNLAMHLIKTHRKESNYLNKKETHSEFQYFCPESGCKYHFVPEKNSSERRWFVKFKYLKQHYMKVHLAKLFICNGCDKSFSTNYEREQHEKTECGKKFACLGCPFMYQSYVSLLAHCKRKNHPLDRNANRGLKMQRGSGYLSKTYANRRILPKPEVDSSVGIAAAALSELSRKVVVKGVDKGVQTLGGSGGGGRRKGGVWGSRETQTQVRHSPRISAETQTTAILCQRRKSVSRVRRRKKSMETQTNRPIQVNGNNFIISSLNNATENYEIDGPLDDMVLSDLLSTSERNSSGTQTTPETYQIVLDVRQGLNLDLFSEEGATGLGHLIKDSLEPNNYNQSSETSLICRNHSSSSLLCDDQICNDQSSSATLICVDLTSTGTSICDDSSSCELYTNEQIDRLIQQSTMFDETRSCNIETQTDLTDGLIDDCPILSNMETQTIQNAIDEYSNNYTQTCDDIFLNDFVEFSDIETQTAWANLTIESALVTAETQTAL